ncbi:MAG TPA: TldD/PmbA family protein [Candidatus Sulfotelmatobacter sp.]|nr:TldD/PmbA family protein [Candidatus Sulfotelmatobacter sp.]
MLTRDQAADIFDRIRKISSADEVEVLFSGGKFALTRFANNTIHQNVAEENYAVSVRTAFGGRTARASTNKFDDESLRRVVGASEELAKVQHPDPDLLPMPDPREAAGGSDQNLTGEAPVSTRVLQPPRALPSRHFAETAAITPQLRADGVRKIVDVAQKHNLTTAGVFSSGESIDGIFNSRGLANWHTQTSSEISITMLGADSSGWQKANSPNVKNLDPLALAEIAAKKALDSARPQQIPAGKYTVILEASAALDIVGFMFWDYAGMAILDQRSFLNGRVGTRLFGENITIWDDVSHPLQSGSPFDGEGVMRKRLALVENGVVKRLVYARATAARMKRSEYKDTAGPIEPTGHGFALPNEMGELPQNIVFAAPRDTQTVEQMIASTERGVLVTRLWYIREVEPFEKMLTGMTRDGTFYVENGRLQHGVRNFRFNESLIHMLANVEAMSIPARASGEESFDMVVPAMKVRDFNFTEVTKF